jgi:AcrR family transcriptional regulator
VTRSARPSLTERRAEELRLEIALTARDLFVADGDTSATVERICEVVGINPRTFHRHFPVKEDVIIPLLRTFGKVSLEVLERFSPDADPIDTLVQAFTTEVAGRHVEEFDRKFMTLIVKDPQYRLRWLDWGEDLCEPVTEFLSRHFDLGGDPFLRNLPTHLILETGRQVYIRWVDSGDFAELEASHRAGMRMILSSLRPREYAMQRHSELKSEPVSR